MRLVLFAIGVAVTGSAALPTAPYRPAVTAADTNAEARNRMVKQLVDSLGERVTLPAESIWTGLKTNLRKVPARQLLAIMNMGYGRSLGVACTFCHVPGHYDREDSTQKQVARDMSAMAARINQELLAAIPGIKDKNPIVNCTTCHRGQVKPALNLDDAGAK